MCDPKEYDMSEVLATLHFDLETHEGERRLRECLDAPAFRATLVELDEWLRQQSKYHDVFKVDVGSVRKRINLIAEGHGIDIWED
jgi:hypothetical protein